MPIAKGEPWGEPATVPADVVVVRSDAEARRVVEAARREKRPVPPLGLLGGDLCRTLGGGGGALTGLRGPNALPGLRGPNALHGVRFPIDLGEVLLDGRLRLFVAHVVARNRLWTRAFVSMNAQWLGNWNLGPRAHPNDGLLDNYEAQLPPSQLLVVRSRLHHGAHLPHPGIKERRTGAMQVELDQALPVRIDGERVGAARTLVVRVIPDALTVFV